MVGNDVLVMRISVDENVLYEVVAVLITGDCIVVSKHRADQRSAFLTVNKGHTRSIDSTLADTIQVAIHEVWTGNLQTLLNNF